MNTAIELARMANYLAIYYKASGYTKAAAEWLRKRDEHMFDARMIHSFHPWSD